MRHANIALIGFMAAGKTSVGRALAARLQYSFVDTDELLVAQAGCAIPTIFAAEGEAGFRLRERWSVAHAAAQQRHIIACGGGVARDERNVAVLRAAGEIVWLRVGVAVATARILADGRGRPMIDEYVPERTAAHVARRVAALLAEREAFYRAAANRVVDVDHRSVDDIVAAIAAAKDGFDG